MYIFPSKKQYQPHEDKLYLLNLFLSEWKYPGFIHESFLRINMPGGFNQANTSQIVSCLETMKRTMEMSEYFFQSFDKPMTYIMRKRGEFEGIVITGLRSVYWFEIPISFTELHFAMQQNFSIITGYSFLGAVSACDLCDGQGAIDWVDSIKSGMRYNQAPDNRYLVTTHRDIHLLTDNKWIKEYKGDCIISVCPKCYGSGINSIFTVSGNPKRSVEHTYFDDNPLGYYLLLDNAFDSLIPDIYPSGYYSSNF